MKMVRLERLGACSRSVLIVGLEGGIECRHLWLSGLANRQVATNGTGLLADLVARAAVLESDLDDIVRSCRYTIHDKIVFGLPPPRPYMLTN